MNAQSTQNSDDSEEETDEESQENSGDVSAPYSEAKEAGSSPPLDLNTETGNHKGKHRNGQQEKQHQQHQQHSYSTTVPLNELHVTPQRKVAAQQRSQPVTGNGKGQSRIPKASQSTKLNHDNYTIPRM